MEGLLNFVCTSTLVLLLSSTIGVLGFNRFGCNFSNEHYYLKAPSILEPVFGNRIEPYQINDVNRLRTGILERATEIMKNIMGSTIVNQLDSYIEFYNAFLATQQDFNTFFENYVPRYSKYQYSGFVIAVLNQLIKEFPQLENHCFLSAAYVAVPGDQYEDSDNDNPREYFRNNHVAGVIRIRIQNEEGIILLEPGLGIDTPIVLTQNGQYLHTDHVNKKTVPGKEEIWNLNMDSDGKYVIAKVYDYENPNNIKEVHLYYMEKAFCSVLDTTLKTNLLTKSKMISKRSKTGAQLASIHFKLVYKSKFQIIYLDDYENNQLKVIAWSNLSKLKQEDQLFFEHMARTLRENSTDLINKLQTIYTSLNNYEFMTGKERMYDYVNPDICKPSQENSIEGGQYFDYSTQPGHVEFRFEPERPTTKFFKKILKKITCSSRPHR